MFILGKHHPFNDIYSRLCQRCVCDVQTQLLLLEMKVTVYVHIVTLPLMNNVNNLYKEGKISGLLDDKR